MKMNMKKMNMPLKAILFAVMIAGFAFMTSSCRDFGMDHHKAGSREQITADTSFVDSLKITVFPITDSNAIAIAQLASGGKEVSVTQETFEKIPVFTVKIQVGSLFLFLHVRISDGALIKDNDGG